MKPSLLFVGLGGHVQAVDRANGSTVWTTPISAGRHQLVAHQGRVYVAVEGGKLHILSAADGTAQVQVGFSGRGQAPTVLIEEGTLFIGSGGTLHAFDLDGKALWSNEFSGKSNGAMSLATLTQDRQADEY